MKEKKRPENVIDRKRKIHIRHSKYGLEIIEHNYFNITILLKIILSPLCIYLESILFDATVLLTFSRGK